MEAQKNKAIRKRKQAYKWKEEEEKKDENRDDKGGEREKAYERNRGKRGEGG